MTYLSLGATNLCSFDTVILGTTTDSEYLVMPGNSGVGFSGGVRSDDPRLIFASVSSQQICATLERTSQATCGVDGVVVSAVLTKTR